MARTKNTKPTKKKGKSTPFARAMFAVLVILAVLALGFFLVIRDQGRTSLAENLTGSIFSPIQNAVSSATRYIRDVVSGVKDYFVMGEELALAKQQITTLQLQLGALEEDAIENERLTELLDAKESHEAMDPVYARVIARNPGVWFNTFSINRGENHGVKINMAVVTGDGLVGLVTEVGSNYAKVLSIIDPRSSVACLIQRTRDDGVMRGQVSSSSITAECNMYYLPTVNNIIPGDVVLTSGQDTRFPKGLKVGTVASVSRQSDLADQYIVVLPSVDFLHLEEVLVLRTVVESDSAPLPGLPTPVPTPAPTPEDTPAPTGGETPSEEEGNPYWSWPTPLPEGVEPGMTPDPNATPTPTPAPTFDPDTMIPEDQWTI